MLQTSFCELKNVRFFLKVIGNYFSSTSQTCFDTAWTVWAPKEMCLQQNEIAYSKVACVCVWGVLLKEEPNW